MQNLDDGKLHYFNVIVIIHNSLPPDAPETKQPNSRLSVVVCETSKRY